MIADYEIREKVAQYLTSRISLDQFEDWLVARSWNMHADSDRQSQKLASEIELRLAEYSSGHLTEQDLRRELVPYVTRYFITYGSYQPVLSSANDIIKAAGAFQVAYLAPIPAEQQAVGTKPAVVYG